MEARTAPKSVQHGPALYRDLCADFGQVQRFFRLDPFDDQAYERRAEELMREHPPSLRDRAVAESLLAHNRRLGASEAALLGLQELANGSALAVVAAQTPALLTGPLFTLWKAVTLVELARRLTDLLGRPVVPLFWVAADDHDFHQLRQIHVIDRQGRLRRLALDLTPPPRLTAGEIVIPRQQAAALWGRLERLVPSGDHLDEVRELVRWRGLGEPASPVNWFSRILVGLLSGHGLAVVDPRLLPLRQHARSLMQQALVRRELMMRELRAAGQRLRKHDYETVYRPEPGHTFMFHHRQGSRSTLFWRDSKIQDRLGQLALKPPELARRLHRDPERFSPNAVLRSVVQDYLLPTVAVVAGAEETVFYAQIRDIYPLFGLQLPVVHPRISVTLIEAQDQSVMRRYGLNVPRVIKGLNPVLDAELKRLAAVDLDERFAAEVAHLRQRYAGLATDLSQISPHLEAITQRNVELVEAQVAYLKRKALQHHRRQHRDLVKAFQTLQRRLQPNEMLQEQVLNIMPFLIRHGPDLPARVMEHVPLAAHHQFLYLDPPAAAAAVEAENLAEAGQGD